MLCSTARAVEAKPEPPELRAVYTFEYRDGAATPDINEFFYLNTGFRLDHAYVSFEIDTMLLVIIGDVIALLFKYMAGGGDDLPLYDALNGDTEPGYYSFFHMAARYNAIRAESFLGGVGLQTQLSQIDATFAGERVPVAPFDVGLSLDARRRLSPELTVGAAVSLGNGWTSYAAFNPYHTTTAWLNYQLRGPVGVFARGAWKRQRIDMTSYDVPNPPVDPQLVRIEEWIDLWAIDGGLSLSF